MSLLMAANLAKEFSKKELWFAKLIVVTFQRLLLIQSCQLIIIWLNSLKCITQRCQSRLFKLMHLDLNSKLKYAEIYLKVSNNRHPLQHRICVSSKLQAKMNLGFCGIHIAFKSTTLLFPSQRMNWVEEHACAAQGKDDRSKEWQYCIWLSKWRIVNSHAMSHVKSAGELLLLFNLKRMS